jgi:hypothetical protein
VRDDTWRRRRRRRRRRRNFNEFFDDVLNASSELFNYAGAYFSGRSRGRRITLLAPNFLLRCARGTLGHFM